MNVHNTPDHDLFVEIIFPLSYCSNWMILYRYQQEVDRIKEAVRQRNVARKNTAQIGKWQFSVSEIEMLSVRQYTWIISDYLIPISPIFGCECDVEKRGNICSKFALQESLCIILFRWLNTGPKNWRQMVQTWGKSILFIWHAYRSLDEVWFMYHIEFAMTKLSR